MHELTASGFCRDHDWRLCQLRLQVQLLTVSSHGLHRITHGITPKCLSGIFRCPQIALLGTSYGTSKMLVHDRHTDRHTAAARRTIKPSSLCQLNPTPCIMTSARSLLLLAFALLATLNSATAATDVSQGDIYLLDSVHHIDNYTDLKAGQSYVANFQVNAQASNATIGSVLGFCTVLQDVGSPNASTQFSWLRAQCRYFLLDSRLIFYHCSCYVCVRTSCAPVSAV